MGKEKLKKKNNMTQFIHARFLRVLKESSYEVGAIRSFENKGFLELSK